MAHMIETTDAGMSKGAPWHIAQTAKQWHVSQETMTPEEATSIGWKRQDGQPGIWNPLLIPTYASAGGTERVLIPGSWHTARDDMDLTDPRRFLSVGRGMSDKYTLITNTDIKEYAEALCGAGAHVDSCGSVMGGRRVFLSMYLPGGADIEGEEAANHMLLTTEHAGTASFEALLAPMLTVCMNTLQWNRRAAKTKYKIRHTKTATDRMSEAYKIIEVAQASFGDNVDVMRALAKKKITDEAARKFVEEIQGFTGESTRTTNSLNRVMELYHGEQIAADSKARKGTVFGLVNAFSQYIETEHVVGCHTDAVTGEKRSETDVRFNSVVFGSGARKRDEVMNKAAALLEV